MGWPLIAPGLYYLSSAPETVLGAFLSLVSEGWPRHATTARDGCRVLEGGRCGSRRRQRPARSGRPLRPPGQPVEPEDAAVHLRQAQPDPHHRPARNRPRPAACLQVPVAGRRPRRARDVRRHQAAGEGNRRARSGPLRHAVRQRALAGRHPHELPHHPQPAQAAPGTRSHVAPGRREPGEGRPEQLHRRPDDRGRQARPGQGAGHVRHPDALQEDDLDLEPRTAQDPPEPDGHPRHDQAARTRW